MSTDTDVYKEFVYPEDIIFIGERRLAGEPIGYPPNNFVRRALEKQYVSIVGAIDIGDFETFLRESADLTYEEAKDKMVALYGTPKEISAAAARAKSRQAKQIIEAYEEQAESEQRTLEDEFAEVEQIARQRLDENLALIRRTQELEAEIERLRGGTIKKPELPHAEPVPSVSPTPAVSPKVPSQVPPYTPIGYPPSEEYRRVLANLYISIFGEMNEEDFDNFLRESADLTLTGAKNKLGTWFWKELEESIELPKIEFPKPPASITSPVKPAPSPTKPVALKPEEYVFIPPVPHGSRYHDIKDRISPLMTRRDINELADEIYGIIERGDYDKLSRKEADDILKQLSEMSGKISMAELERRVSPPQIGAPGIEGVLHGIHTGGERSFIGRVPERVIYIYTTPRKEMDVSPSGEEFFRDIELEDTLRLNGILNFPDRWYKLSPADKIRLYGWNMATAVIEEVVYRHKFTWDELNRDYGIPQYYIDGWIEYGKSIGLIE